LALSRVLIHVRLWVDVRQNLWHQDSRATFGPRMAYWAYRIPLQIISYLPWWALYVLSDALFLVIFYLIGYRRKLVRANLAHAFPEKSQQQRDAIERQFYRNLCDMMVETVKMMTADAEDVCGRFEFNDSVYRRLHPQGKSILLASGHMFNWEWANWLLPCGTPYRTHVIFMIMGSPALERVLTELRGRQGSILIPANDVRNMMAAPERPTVTIFLADQNPSDLRRAHWTDFMGRKAPFHRGLEIMARRTGQAVVFEDMVRTGRGRYRNVTHVAFENATGTTDGEVTEAFVRWLEERILQHPENWLWTHNRWKHRPR